MTECGVCGRERRPEDGEYNALQLAFDQPFGWYTGADGIEVCPEDMERMVREAGK